MICAFEVKENEPALETSEKGGDVEVIEEVTEKTNETEKEDNKKDNEDEPTEVEPMDDHDYSAFDDSEVAEVVEHKVEFIEHPIESSKNEHVAIETPKKEVSENVAKKRDEFQACLSDSVTKKIDPAAPTTADEDDEFLIISFGIF